MHCALKIIKELSKSIKMNQLATSTKFIWLSIILLICIMACQKEKLTVRDVPFEDLTASFYVLAEQTVEIPMDLVNSLILSRKEDALVLSDDPIFADLAVGSVVITELGTPHADVILRKVIGIDRSGQQISLITEPAGIVDAYSEYYFNSEFEDVYSFKTGGTNLSGAGGGASSQLFKAFNEAPGSLFEVSPIFEFDGEVSFEAIHPHTAYKYFFCNNDNQCFNNIDKTDVMPMNGYYDVVDQAFNNTLSDDLARNGLYTIKFANFGLKALGLSLGTKKDGGGSLAFDDGSSVDVLEGLIRSSLKQQSTADPQDVLNLKYISTPATFWGLFTITLAMTPVLDFSLRAAAYKSLELTFPNRVDIVMGHINWSSTIPSAKVDFKITKNGQSTSLSHLTENGVVNATIAVDGEMEAKLGLGVGAAISSGEANTAGVSIGAILEVAMYFKVFGGFGARFSDVLNMQNGGNVETFGRLCFDAGLAYDAYLFTDANLGPFVGDFFDHKFTIPKERLGIKNFSVLFQLKEYQEGVGVCYEKNGCDSMQVDILNFGLDDQEQLWFEWKIDNPALSNSTFRIKMKTSLGDFTVGTTYNYGEHYTMVITHGRDGILNGVRDGILKIEIEDTNHNCNKAFDKNDFGYIISCVDSPYEYNIHDKGTTEIDLVGNEITYFERSEAEAHCGEEQARLIGAEALENLLENWDCVNPTGFLIDNIGGTSKSNSNKAYIWIEQESNGHQIMSIEFDQKAGEAAIKSFKTEAASPSVKAAAVCAEK